MKDTYEVRFLILPEKEEFYTSAAGDASDKYDVCEALRCSNVPLWPWMMVKEPL